MKRRITYSMSLLAFIAILVTSVLILYIVYNSMNAQTRNALKDEASYATALYRNSRTDGFKGLLAVHNSETRITLISGRGTVLFDNKADPKQMENHFTRPEVQEALRDGSSDSRRLSATLGKQTFYHAVLLEDGNILRLSRTTDSIFSVFWKLIPTIFLLIAAVFIFVLILSRRLTRWIIRPIHRLDLEHPMENVFYDEFSPLLARLSHQGEEIQKYISALKTQQEEFSAIVGNMSEGLVLLDKNNSILAVNTSALDILGQKGSDFQGKSFLLLSRNIFLQKAVQDALGGLRKDVGMELDGRVYQVLASPVYKNGEVKGALLLILDITEKHEAEKMRREFSANVSHELKTPLTSISGFAEMMMNKMVKADDVPGFAEKIHMEAQRLIALVEDILRISRLDESVVPESLEPVDLLALSRDIANRLANMAQQKNVSVLVGGESAILYGEKTVLDELIFNLCENAVKYNKNPGKVNIDVSKNVDAVVLKVSDTGIGIPVHHQERIFERFYRVDKSHSKQTGGTGLGLSIVKHAALRHHAQIKLESVENIGTGITVTFPMSLGGRT